MLTLIAIRGPSGSGKSTVAARLFAATDRPTAVVDLDHYRFMFRNHPPGVSRIEYTLAGQAIESSLDAGFNVIFDGNFRLLDDGELPLPLFSYPDAESYAFYLQVGLEETLRRHAGRVDQRIDAARMRALYEFAQPLGHARETVIPEGATLEETLATIRRVTGV